MKKSNQNQKFSEKFKYISCDFKLSNKILNQFKTQNNFNSKAIKNQINSFKSKNDYLSQPFTIYRQQYNSNISQSMVKSNSCKKSFQKQIQFKSLQKKKSSVLRDRIIKQYGNSPYIKNIKDFDKIERLMTPAKQPTQSIKLQIKRHNHTSHNIRNHQNVILRSSQNFQQKIQTFLKRLGLRKGSKTFIMNSKDYHIKQELILRGWNQLLDRESTFFHLKWVYIDNTLDYSKLHINSTTILIIINNSQIKIIQEKMFPENQRPNLPLTFDLGLKQDYREFQQTYFIFRSIKILNLLINIISKFNSKYYERIMKNKNYFLHQNYKKNSDRENNTKQIRKSQVFVKGNLKKKNICLQKLSQNVSENQLSKEIMIMLKRNQKLMDNKYQSQSNTNSQGMFLKEFFMFICSLTKVLTEKTGTIYSFFNFNQSSLALWKIQKFEVLEHIQSKLKDTLEIIQILQKFSNFFIVEIVKVGCHLQKIFGAGYGNNNAWIIKPVGVSRGAGISIKTNYYQIASNKNAKIVQKYIQKPLLFKCQRKFDIRQWILVKRFSPLQVYIFKNCYGRLCPQIYTSTDFQNHAKHLTNFSLSKQLYKNNSLNSILLEADIIHELGQQIWDKIKNQIKLQIIKTLKCCQHQVIQTHQNNFQIYGFDIMIDQNYKPWVIEVNLSPACEKREGLDKYLKQMATGIVDMLQNKSPLSNWELLQQQLIFELFSKQKQITRKKQSASKICRFLINCRQKKLNKIQQNFSLLKKKS